MSITPPRSDDASDRLQGEIAALRESLLDFQGALFGVNDPQLVDAFRSPMEFGRLLVDLHEDRATSTIADDAANLRSLFARHHVPREDRDLGPTESLKKLRSARGALLADVDELLLAAAHVGLKPRQSAFQAPAMLEVEVAGLTNMLAGLERRLATVGSALDALRQESGPSSARTPKQIGLVNFFIENLSVEAALAKLEASSTTKIDFANLTRAVESMAELTRNFVVTVRAMKDKVTQSLRKAAEAFRPLVGRVARGLVAVIYRVRRVVLPVREREAQAAAERMRPDGNELDERRQAALKVLSGAFGGSEQLAIEILEKGQIRHYRNAETILPQGENAQVACVLLTGRAQALLYSLEGQTVMLREYGVGDFFGALGDIDPTPEEAETVAVENSDVFALEVAVLRELIEKHSSMGLALSRLMLQQLRKATSRIYERTALSATGRVHAELLRIARQSPQMRIEPPPVLSELAIRVSTTRETASRALTALEQRGIISRNRNSLTVLNPARLEELIV